MLIGDFDDPRVVPIALAVGVMIVAVWFVVLPVAILVLDVVFVLVLAAVGIAVRLLFRRPWIVEAVTTDEGVQWPVVGLRASRRLVGGVVHALELGHSIDSISPTSMNRLD